MEGGGMIKPILKYPGAKWKIAPWIIRYFPEHHHYVEPYCGSAAIFFTKTPSGHEVLNDLNSDIVNLFRVIRTRGEELAYAIAFTPWSEEEYHAVEHHWQSEDELEWARNYLIRCWQAHGIQLGKRSQGWKHNGLNGRAFPARFWKQLPERIVAVIDRLKDAEIRNKPALEIIGYYNAPDVLLYVDPPYMKSTRLGEGHYHYEMTDKDHEELLAVLIAHQGMIILSGYTHPLYERHLQHWIRVTATAGTEHGHSRTEVLWLNPKAAQSQQLRMFAESEATA